MNRLKTSNIFRRAERGQIATFAVVVIILVSLAAILLVSGLATQELKFSNRTRTSAEAEKLARAAAECGIAAILAGNFDHLKPIATVDSCKALLVSAATNKKIDIKFETAELGNIGGINYYTGDFITGIGQVGSTIRAVRLEKPITCNLYGKALSSNDFPDINKYFDATNCHTLPGGDKNCEGEDGVVYGDNDNEATAGVKEKARADFYDAIGKANINGDANGNGRADDPGEDEEIVGCLMGPDADAKAIQSICDATDPYYEPIKRRQVERGVSDAGILAYPDGQAGLGNNPWLITTIDPPGPLPALKRVDLNLVITARTPIYADLRGGLDAMSLVFKSTRNVVLKNTVLIAHVSDRTAGNQIDINTFDGVAFDGVSVLPAGQVYLQGATLVALRGVIVGSKGDKQADLRIPNVVYADGRTLIKILKRTNNEDNIYIRAETLVSLSETCLSTARGIDITARNGYVYAPRMLFVGRKRDAEGGLTSNTQITAYKGSGATACASVTDGTIADAHGAATRCGSINMSGALVSERDANASVEKSINFLADQFIDIRNVNELGSSGSKISIAIRPGSSYIGTEPRIFAQNAIIRAYKTIEFDNTAADADIALGGAKLTTSIGNETTDGDLAADIAVVAGRHVCDTIDIATDTCQIGSGSLKTWAKAAHETGAISIQGDRRSGDGVNNGDVLLHNPRFAAGRNLFIKSLVAGGNSAGRDIQLDYPCFEVGNPVSGPGQIDIRGARKTKVLSDNAACVGTVPETLSAGAAGTWNTTNKCSVVYVHGHPSQANTQILVGKGVGSYAASDIVRIFRGLFLMNRVNEDISGEAGFPEFSATGGDELPTGCHNICGVAGTQGEECSPSPTCAGPALRPDEPSVPFFACGNTGIIDANYDLCTGANQKYACFYSTLPLLRAWWRLDESAGTNADDSYASNDGVLCTTTGSPCVQPPLPQWQPGGGKIAGALSFNGTYFVRTTSIDYLDSGMTVAAWVKYNKADCPGECYVVSKDNDTNPSDTPYTISCTNTGDCRFYVKGRVLSTGNGPTPGIYGDSQWHLLVATFEYGGTAPNFTQSFTFRADDGNGVMRPQDDPDDPNDTHFDDALANNSVRTTIGGALANPPGNNPWRGSIDDVRIYERKLKPEEIQKLYNLTLACPYNPAPTQYDPFDDDAGNDLQCVPKLTADPQMVPQPAIERIGVNNFKGGSTDSCADGLDNDADTKADGNDPDCYQIVITNPPNDAVFRAVATDITLDVSVGYPGKLSGGIGSVRWHRYVDNVEVGDAAINDSGCTGPSHNYSCPGTTVPLNANKWNKIVMRGTYTDGTAASDTIMVCQGTCE